MVDKKKELEQLLKGFEDELVASVSREERLKEHIVALENENRRLAGQLGAIRFRSWVRRKIDDPKSKIGKVIRLPRTAYRLVRFSEVRKDIGRKARGESFEEGEKVKVVQPVNAPQKLAFAPIDFFVSDNNERRVNLVIKNLDKDLLREAVELAHRNKCELRVITYGESVDPMKYRRMVEKKEVPEAESISFYSSVDQAGKENVFKLEIGKKDIFLTNSWRIDEGK